MEHARSSGVSVVSPAAQTCQHKLVHVKSDDVTYVGCGSNAKDASKRSEQSGLKSESVKSGKPIFSKRASIIVLKGTASD